MCPSHCSPTKCLDTFVRSFQHNLVELCFAANGTHSRHSCVAPIHHERDDVNSTKPASKAQADGTQYIIAAIDKRYVDFSPHIGYVSCSEFLCTRTSHK